MKKERQFCTEVINSLKACGAAAYKIPDMPASFGGDQMRFSAPKGVDIIACHHGRSLLIECKFYREFKGFGLTQLRDDQIKTLDAFSAAGSSAYVFLNIWMANQENRCLIFEWSWFKQIQQHAGKCIPKKEIETYPYLKGKKGLFDLTEFLSELRAAA
jgi:penicillin-binding protein-related factor A (putative recombinase)